MKLHTRVLFTDISVTVEPKLQVTVPGSIVDILCHADVSNYEWKEIHFDYTNDTTSLRMLSMVPNDSSRIFGNKANATVLSKNDNVNISFVLLTTEVVPFCNTKMELTCNIEFLDKTLGRKNDTGTVIVKGQFCAMYINSYKNRDGVNILIFTIYFSAFLILSFTPYRQ